MTPSGARAACSTARTRARLSPSATSLDGSARVNSRRATYLFFHNILVETIPLLGTATSSSLCSRPLHVADTAIRPSDDTQLTYLGIPQAVRVGAKRSLMAIPEPVRGGYEVAA